MDSSTRNSVWFDAIIIPLDRDIKRELDEWHQVWGGTWVHLPFLISDINRPNDAIKDFVEESL